MVESRAVELRHAPVLLAEVLTALDPQPGKIYIDCTLGRGGHARAIAAAAACTVIGIDRDPEALAAVPDLQTVHGQLGDIVQILAGMNLPRVDGFLLDLGVSSPQLDDPARGFSFQREGPLDMRMDPTRGPTALELIRETDEGELANLIFELGEERLSRKIAHAIKAAEATLVTTLDLATLISRVVPFAEQRKSKIHCATRTFQALRIAVNGELDQLARFLDAFPDLLAPGGRCAVISFHSLEDRLVKQRFRDLAWTSSLPPALAAQVGERTEAVCEPITRKAVVAGEAETAGNPRARSARLRACERTAAPNLPSGAPLRS